MNKVFADIERYFVFATLVIRWVEGNTVNQRNEADSFVLIANMAGVKDYLLNQIVDYLQQPITVECISLPNGVFENKLAGKFALLAEGSIKHEQELAGLNITPTGASMVVERKDAFVGDGVVVLANVVDYLFNNILDINTNKVRAKG